MASICLLLLGEPGHKFPSVDNKRPDEADEVFQSLLLAIRTRGKIDIKINSLSGKQLERSRSGTWRRVSV